MTDLFNSAQPPGDPNWQSSVPGPTPAPVPQQRSTLRWIIPALIALVALGVGLLGGILIGKATSTHARAFGNGRSFGGFQGGAGGAGGGGAGTAGGTGAGGAGGGFGGVTAGRIDSVSGSTITITTAAGTKVTVTVPSSATVTKTAPSTASQLKAGERVTVVGQPGSNGSITARIVSEGASGLRGLRPGSAATANPNG